MKTYIKNSFAVPLMLAVLGKVLAGRAEAQAFTVLHCFSANLQTNSDGAAPYAGLILSGNTLYGTASSGGAYSFGTVFAVSTEGTGFTNLHSFTGGNEGIRPIGLLLSGTTLYGTAGNGSSGNGTVFAVHTNGTGFTNLYSFTDGAYTSPSQISYSNSDGANPNGLILSGNTLYGTAYAGGIYGNGSLFAINTDGTGFTNLDSFAVIPDSPPYTNNDGANPAAGLTLSGEILYGTAVAGGSSAIGVVFKVKNDGTGFTNLHSFTGFPAPDTGTNSDGANPFTELVLADKTLYGMSSRGGGSGSGTVFAVNTDGTGFTVLHSFTALDPNTGINSDGANPNGLIVSGNTLYGTAFSGSIYGNGSLFAINTDGTGFTVLHGFTAFDSITEMNSDGAYPLGRLVLSGNTLYGTAVAGGSYNSGTVFSISFQPQLTITASPTNVILTWPTNYAGFDYAGYTLQSAIDLAAPAWTDVSPTPVAVNGQNTVTNPISGSQQFFRLSK